MFIRNTRLVIGHAKGSHGEATRETWEEMLTVEPLKLRLMLCIPVHSSQAAVEGRRLVVEASKGGQCAPRVTHDPSLAFRFLLRTANVDPDRHFKSHKLIYKSTDS